MFCKECGKRIEDNNKFCPYCGTQVDESENVKVNENASGNVRATVKPVVKSDAKLVAKKKSNTKKNAKADNKNLFLLIGLIALALIIVIIISVVFLRIVKYREQRENSSPVPASNPISTEATTEAKTPETEAPVAVPESEATDKSAIVQAFTEYTQQFEPFDLNGISYTHERSEYSYTATPLDSMDGIFKTKIVDIDGDGAEELLTFSLYHDSSSEQVKSEIHAKVFEYKDGKVEQTADAAVATDVFNAYNDMVGLRIALKDNHYICVDNTSNTFLEADGGCIDMQLWEYNGETLMLNAKLTYSASDWYEASSYCEDIRPQLEAAGLYRTVEQVYKFGIFSFSMADSGMQAICKITGDLDVADPYGSNASVVHTVLKFVDENPETDYLFPDSANSAINEPDLERLSKDQLRLARNELFARYSWVFDSQELQSYYESKAWYLQSYSCFESPGAEILTDTEKNNADLIKKYEK